MAKFLSMFQGGAGQARDVEKTLVGLERGKEAVRMEVERTKIRFTTRISVKRGAVVVAKPPTLGNQIQTGSHVRFSVPGDASRNIRMEVMTPHFNLSNDKGAFLCKMPTEFAEAPKRKSERFDTRRFANLQLAVPGHAEPFQVVDISQTGFRIKTGYTKPRDHMKMAVQIPEATLRLGKNARLQFAMIVPRSFEGQTVGLSFTVEQSGEHRKLLTHLLRSLETAQRQSVGA